MSEVRTEIVVCPACKGVGLQYVKNEDGSVYLRHGKPVTEECEMCRGERVLLKKVTTEYFLLEPGIIEEEEKKGFFGFGKKK